MFFFRSRTHLRLLFLFANLLFLPLLVSRLEAADIAAGKTVKLTAAVSGVGPFVYKWYKNNVFLTDRVGAILTITNFQSSNAGSYNVQISNVAGSTTAPAVSLKLLAAPVFTTQPSSKTVLTGTSVTLSAAASGSPTYQWRKNGVNISGATGSSYRISSVSSTHAGTYSVVARNSMGSATSANATLKIGYAPRITTQPVAQKASVGGRVAFTVVASGTPAPTYQWRKNGVAITGATGATYSIATVSTSHAGTYSVLVKNSLGSVTSTGVALTVSSTTATSTSSSTTTTTTTSKPPAITTQPTSRTVMAGVSTTFSVAATGSPTPTYQWRKNGTAISGATSSRYVISNPKAADVGTYSVVVKNSVGTVTSSNATLTVKPLVHADLNGDGKSDILWENILTGDHRLWLMTGTSKISGLDLATTSKDWEVIGPGEFNADGKTDILIQNMATREVKVWLMSGSTVSSSVSLGIPGTGMYVAGVGDFNGDNKSDIIWRNAATNEHSIRLMNGTTPGTSVSLGVRSTTWEVAGTGDFNGDKKTDILWENSGSSTLGLWVMNGTTYGSWVDMPAAGRGWVLGGTGDFNGDGKPDLLWQNTGIGARKVVLMSGVVKSSETSLGTVDAEWFITN
jgi:hypothetical protein